MMKYYSQIDSLRAIAVLAVVLNHLDEKYLPSGYLGVDIFFTISGFVVLNSLLNKKEEKPLEFLKAFYRQRFKRLFPALLTCFFIVTPIAIALTPDPFASIKTGIAALFAHSNLYLIQQSLNYFDSDATMNFFTHTWSLSLEEQFYFIFPLIFIFSGMLKDNGRGKGKFIFASLIFITTSLVFYIWNMNVNFNWAFYLMPSRLWQLMLGSLICLMNTDNFPLKKYLNIALNVCVSLIFIVLISSNHQMLNTILVTVLTAGVLFLIKSGAESQILNLSKISGIGKMSYSIYLWHWPLIVLFKSTIGLSTDFMIGLLLLMIGLSSMSYFFIENYFRRKKNWGILLGVAFFILPVSSLMIKEYFEPISKTVFLGNPLESFAWENKKCNVGTEDDIDFKYSYFKDRVFTDCVINNTGPRRIFLFGNSYAEQLIPTFEKYLEQNPSSTLYAFAAPDCPVWTGEPLGKSSKCRTIFSMAKRLVFEEFKEGDVFFVATPFYHFFDDNKFMHSKGDIAFEQLKKELEELTRDLGRKGISLALTNSIPILNIDARTCYQPWSYLNKRCELDKLVNNDITKKIIHYNKLFRVQGAKIVDIYSPIKEKLKSRDGIRAFRETDHLSAFSAEYLLKTIKDSLETKQ